jgi:hypothetical protein
VKSSDLTLRGDAADDFCGANEEDFSAARFADLSHVARKRV